LEQLRCSRQAPLEARCRQVPFRERSGAVVEPDREEELKLKAVGEMVEKGADSAAGWRPKVVVATAAEAWIRP